MSENTYWSQVLEHRLSRRRAVVASGATALGAAFLAACGSSDKGGGEKAATSLLTKPADTAKQAVRGGTMKTYARAFITHYDVHNTQTAGQGIPDLTHSRFVQTSPAISRLSTTPRSRATWASRGVLARRPHADNEAAPGRRLGAPGANERPSR